MSKHDFIDLARTRLENWLIDVIKSGKPRPKPEPEREYILNALDDLASLEAQIRSDNFKNPDFRKLAIEEQTEINHEISRLVEVYRGESQKKDNYGKSI